MPLRTYGNSGRQVIVLHGGPGAAGEMGPVARDLADYFQVLEPFQRGSGDQLLTVATHVADLHDLISTACATPPAIVGHSWGAMLALAYSAAHPNSAASLVLIGCGTFDPVAREQMRSIINQRMTPDLRERLARPEHEILDPNLRMKAMGKLIEPLYTYDPITSDDPDGSLDRQLPDARAFEQTWSDMVRLQDEGVYPAAFAAIHVPVLMLHGAFDPHPGRIIFDSLKPHLPQLESVELEKCGHDPWREKYAREEFFSVLRAWLTRHPSPLRPASRIPPKRI